jgi:hypothetical protein
MGEASVRSGQDGEKIAKEILNLIGWGSLSCNIDIDCSFPTRHKWRNKVKQGKHGIDILYSYDNPLYHDKRDAIIASVKHFENGYPSNRNNEAKRHIEELSIDLDCAKVSDEIRGLIGVSSIKTHYKGLLFWLSSSDNEKKTNLIEQLDQDIDFGSNQFEEIFIVDNNKATFLVSAIKTAESYMKESGIKFLYQNTGKNMDKSQLLISGEKLPVQLINSEIIPIIKEEQGKISCLIFCKNQYSKENLSRLIWFSHKLCGLTNEIRLYFPNYDYNKEYEVNGVKQTFKDESLTTKISVHRWQSFDFVSLKENHNKLFSYPQNQKQIELVFSPKISDDIEKILPYGDMLLPKLKTSILSDVNLKDFLFRKGIVTNKKSKDELLPIFSCLLLSPEELDNLKSTYKEKEDKPKEIERKAKANLGSQTLWETLNQTPLLTSLDNIGLPKNCRVMDNPKIERVRSNYNHVILFYKIEKENTNKDFLTGKSYHTGELEMKYTDNQLIIIDKHTSGETYQINKKYYEKLSKSLKKNNLIQEDFKSISFLDFDNNKRIQFLLSFFEFRDSSVVRVRDMTLEDMKFRADETIDKMPEALDSLKGRVSNLNLHGIELDDTIYLSDEEYRRAELCEKLKYIITYSYLNRSGICYLELSFSGALGKNDYSDAELRISVTPSNYTYDNNFSNTKVKLIQEINRIKDVNYLKFQQKKVSYDTV